MGDELWRVSAQSPYYEVSTLGRVRRALPGNGTKPGRILSNTPMNTGYVIIRLCERKRYQKQLVHLMVLSTFIGSRPPKHECNHKNGIKHDNRLNNLEWVTRSENHRHAFRIGLSVAKHGVNHSMAKLTLLQARKIKYAKSGIRALARKFQITYAMAKRIRNGKNWRELDNDRACRLGTEKQ